METLKIQTINTISSKINLLLTRVQNSTGSLHTKDDVRSLLTNLENELYDELGQVFDNAPVVENFTDQRFTLEEVMSIVESMDYSDYMKADVDSAEFSLSYRNQVELESCDVEFDHDDFYRDIEQGFVDMLATKQQESEITEEPTETI